MNDARQAAGSVQNSVFCVTVELCNFFKGSDTQVPSLKKGIY